MKNYFKNVSPYIIVILVMIIALILTKQCHRYPICSEPTVQIITETDTVYDTIEIVKTIVMVNYIGMVKGGSFIDAYSAIMQTNEYDLMFGNSWDDATDPSLVPKSGYYAKFILYEFAMYSSYLNTTDRQIMENYFMNKYSLP